LFVQVRRNSTGQNVLDSSTLEQEDFAKTAAAASLSSILGSGSDGHSHHAEHIVA
jgi:hypothetical protein